MTENKKMSDADTSKSVWQNDTVRLWGIRALALFAAFLVGFVPMWLSSSAGKRDLATAQIELRRNHIETLLASAVIDARRGKYEDARQSASGFFGEVRTELDNATSNSFNAQEKTKVSELIQNRDEVITLLSRGDNAGAERLSDLYVAYRQAMDEANSARP
jgi:hypothetical protein